MNLRLIGSLLLIIAQTQDSSITWLNHPTVLGVAWPILLGIIATCLAILGWIFKPIKWFRDRKIVLAVSRIREVGPGARILISVAWMRGAPTTMSEYTLINFKAHGLKPFVIVRSDNTTLSPSNLKHVFNVSGNPWPEDEILGVAIQDRRGKWHYSTDFPKDQMYSKSNLRRWRKQRQKGQIL